MEIEQAIEAISASISMIKDEICIPLAEAAGMINAEDIKAIKPVPAFNRSAMDGYAVRAEDIKAAGADTPVRLKVIGQMYAGDNRDYIYEKGSAVRVMTGAMIPDGYDAVVKQEDTDYGEEEVLIYNAVGPYMNYCHKGEEADAGDTVIQAGTRLGRTGLGLAASLGMSEIRVRRPARIALISTGSELVSPGEALPKGKIYNSILSMLCASVKGEALSVSETVICPDDTDEIKRSLSHAFDISDAVITTGGVSVGKRDLIPEVYEQMGIERLFAGVNIQPGTPTMAGIYKGKVILSLSGNPYAALVNFDLYFPYIAAGLMSSKHYIYEPEEAILADPYDKVNKLRRFVRADVREGSVYLPDARHMSSVFGNMDRCNCYIDIPAGCHVSVGDRVKIRRTRETGNR